MYKYLIPVLLIAVACQSGKTSGGDQVVDGVISLDSLKSEVLFLHDEVMPKMGALRRVRKDLMLQADSIVELDSAKAQMLNGLANDIGNASEGMMQWMRAYEPDFEGTEEELRAYFEEQKQAIQEVKNQMESTLAMGEKALGGE